MVHLRYEWIGGIWRSIEVYCGTSVLDGPFRESAAEWGANPPISKGSGHDSEPQLQSPESAACTNGLKNEREACRRTLLDLFQVLDPS